MNAGGGLAWFHVCSVTEIITIQDFNITSAAEMGHKFPLRYEEERFHPQAPQITIDPAGHENPQSNY